MEAHQDTRQSLAQTSGIAVPAARSTDLVTTASKDEVLVYDQERHHIHHLNATTTTVWTLCDGQRTVSELAQAASVDEDAVRLALRKLEDANLLDGTLSTDMRGKVQSRRAFMKKAALAGVAVPMIASVSAPAASAQTSGTPCDGTLTTVAQCSYVGEPCWTGVPGTGTCGFCDLPNKNKPNDYTCHA